MQLDSKLLKKAGIFGIVSSELIVFIGGGFAIGAFLDRKLNTKPIFLVLFTCIGFVSAIMRIRYWYDKESKNN